MTISTTTTEIKSASEETTASIANANRAEVYVLLEYYLKQLRLPEFTKNYDKVAKLCQEKNIPYSGYLERLSEIAVTERSNRNIDTRIKKASFPFLKTLDSFDFSKIPNLNKKLVCELAKCEYIKKRENI